MKRRLKVRRRCWPWMAFFMLFVCLTSFHYPIDILILHIGKPYSTVAKDSTFSVEGNTAIYPGDPNDATNPPHPSSTWISSPTIIEFDDPVYGFRLPPTIFGAVTYDNLKVLSMTTSPMIKTLPFENAVEQLAELQSTLQTRHWLLQPVEENDWFKIETAADRERLQAKLFDQADGIDLYVPEKYNLMLLIKCYARCNERDPKTAKYLIDVSVGRDYFSD
ncbi:hypothetical protein POF45_16240 [Pseudomonas sp. 681]|uniref:Uncharacterized protein n=1 Tax=Pseudomonas fungipugnans TaxID=3024217 RepID=A0ABT6QS04_9PSED|nr:hypothetical protein [Pseudomonas sp. 681]MDI2592967.1 hypothetical protein [Pseudomonas sp. 681]